MQPARKTISAIRLWISRESNLPKRLVNGLIIHISRCLLRGEGIQVESAMTGAEDRQNGDESDNKESTRSHEMSENTKKSENIESNISIPYEESQRIIDKQFEAHYNNQDNIFRLLRSIVAIVAVGVAFVSALISGSASGQFQIPTFEENLSKAISNTSTQVPDIIPIIDSLPQIVPIGYVLAGTLFLSFVSFLCIVLGGFELIVAIYGILTSLSPPKLKPIHRDSEVTYSFTSVENDGEMGIIYNNWIESNRGLIHKSNERLGIVYSKFLKSSIFFAMGIIYLTLAYFVAIDAGVSLTTMLISGIIVYKMIERKLPEDEDIYKAIATLELDIDFSGRENLVILLILLLTYIVIVYLTAV